MNWKTALASAIGTSHAQLGVPCQDSCSAVVRSLPDGSSVLVAVVADGAGSAAAGGYGARIANETVQGVIETWLINHPTDVPDDLTTRRWLAQVREVLADQALVRKLGPYDLACTMLLAVMARRYSVYVQIGDGAIAAGTGGVLTTATWPQVGEYANETRFLTDDDAIEAAQISCSLDVAREVALFTDGLQYLALCYDIKAVHQPFFEPMLKVLRTSKPEDCSLLCEQLAHALSSARINSVTDDDKTIVLATSIDSGQDA